ncbi:very short patch repair endonuclease [Myxococcota bacterium]|nr:very short patch repair endonuclease [Myxococcota bacterium]
MSRIRGSGTRPELALAEALGGTVPYVLNARVDGVRSDLVLEASHTAVFIDGCFWHGCPDHYVRPKSNTDFWAQKLAENVERDRRQTLDLEARGWRVVRLWEHDVFERPTAAAAAVLGAEDALPTPDVRVIRVEVVSEAPLVERRVLATLRSGVLVGDQVGPRVTAKWRRPSLATSPRPSQSTPK